MKYVIVFGAICVFSGLVATFWLWWYAERSISLRTSSASSAEGNSIVQPLLADENGDSSASQPQQDIQPADAIEAPEDELITHSVPTPAVVDAGAVAASAGEEEQQRKDSNSISRKSTQKTMEALVGEVALEGDKGQEESDSPVASQPPEEDKTMTAAQEDQQRRGSSSSSPVVSAGGDGDHEDPPAGIEGNGAGAGAEELGEPKEAPSSSGDPATAS